MFNKVRTVKRVADLPDYWDLLVGDDLYCSLSWLRMIEATYPDPPVYVIAKNKAAVVGYVFTSNSTPSPHMRPDLILARLSAAQSCPISDPSSVLPALTCGGRRGYQSKIFQGNRHSTIKQVHMGLIAVESSAAMLHCMSVVFPYVDETDVVLRGALTSRGYIEMSSGSHAYMPVIWTDFDGYLAALSKKGRSDVRRDLRNLEEGGIRFQTDALTECMIPELAELEVQLNEKHGTARSLKSAQRSLLALLSLESGKVTVIRAFAGERCVGFVLIAAHRGEAHLRQAGFDYESQGTLPIYFGVAFYEVARQAPLQGWHTLHYGTGTMRAKVSRGCSLTEQTFFLKLVRQQGREID